MTTQAQTVSEILIPSLISSISIIFLAITFLLSQYKQASRDYQQEIYLSTGKLMNIALLFTVISLVIATVGVFGIDEICARTICIYTYQLSVASFAAAISFMIGGIWYVSIETWS